MDELVTSDFILFVIGISILVGMILYVLLNELPAGRKVLQTNIQVSLELNEQQRKNVRII